MKTYSKLKLLEKGWNEREITAAERILELSQKHELHFSKMVFWSALVVIIFANLIVSLVLVPFLIVLNKWLLYSIVFLLAGTIGFLYNFLIMDIGHLERKHHILAGIIVPVIALTNMVVMVMVSNRFIQDLKVANVKHNPWMVALFFVLAFIFPSVLDQLTTRLKERRKARVV